MFLLTNIYIIKNNTLNKHQTFRPRIRSSSDKLINMKIVAVGAQLFGSHTF